MRCLRLTLVASLLYASGAHWLVLQSVAWTRMVIAAARTGSTAQALATTFDGRHPCEMCHRIQEGAQSQQQEKSLAPELRLEPCLPSSTGQLQPLRPLWKAADPQPPAPSAWTAIETPPPRLKPA
ncbi:MAG: hypothetical protein WC943_15190 [Elusimicrobiota bacterium]|jgi:hypothetical protein